MMSNRVFECGIVDETAYLNWRANRYDPVGNMCVMAEGYMDASKILLDACLEDNEDKKADGIIFTFLFSFNQGIELCVAGFFGEPESLVTMMVFDRARREARDPVEILREFRKSHTYQNLYDS